MRRGDASGGEGVPAAYSMQGETAAHRPVRRASGTPSPRWPSLPGPLSPRGVSRARQPPPLRARG